jgi:hypothetical protein
MFKLSLKGFAIFISASPSGQRKVLHNFKYPDEKRRSQAKYYRDARKAIAALNL